MDYLHTMTEAELQSVTAERIGERKSGQSLCLLSDCRAGKSDASAHGADFAAALHEARRRGARIALLGIPEDISPRANLGRGGAHEAWNAFLPAWANLQDNRFLDFSAVLLLGCVECADLQERSARADAEELRRLCGVLDQRVAAAVKAVASAQLIPAVIGGGHGGAWGIMQGTVQDGREPDPGLAVINCDPHADYRALEGRHSGNAFSYAHQTGRLQRYHILGLHESYNAENMLERMDRDGVTWISFEDIFVRGKLGWEEALCKSAELLENAALPVGIECDLDSIADMPSSAVLPYGLSLREAARYVYYMASRLPAAYLHLAEAAPCLGADGERRTGRALAWLAACFCKAVTEGEQDPGEAEE